MRSQARRRSIDYGIITVSMTWITPFDCMTLAMVIMPWSPLPSMITQPLPDARESQVLALDGGHRSPCRDAARALAAIIGAVMRPGTT